MAHLPYRDVTVGALLTQLSTDLPDADALMCGDGPRYTFRTLEREARTVARGLLAIGVEPGERVVVWAANRPEWVVLQFALAKIGAVVVAAHTAARARDIAFILTRSGAGTLVTMSGFRGHDYVSTLRELGADAGGIPSLKRLVLLGPGAAAGFLPYAHVRDLAASIGESVLDECIASTTLDDPVNIQFTSGTTGTPKGVVLSSRGVVNNAAAVGDVLGLTPADRLCLCVPMFHAFGYAAGVLCCYTHGASVCPVSAFDPRRVLETVQRERCTVLHGAPTMFLAELESPDFAGYDLTSLRTGIMAGAPCPGPLTRRVIAGMHLPELTIAYGLTEASPGITMTPRDAPVDERTETVGAVLPEMEVGIVDAVTRHDVGPGGRGELRVRGYNVMLGYYGEPDATRAVIDDDGWLYTGDEASVDARGIYRITGRIKDLIIRAGENVSPAEVENCLREHDGVADAAVYGVPDARLGERVAAAVRLAPAVDRPPVTEGELIAWCRKRLAPFKAPAEIRFLEELPTTPSGKIQKFRLRETHAAAPSAASLDILGWQARDRP